MLTQLRSVAQTLLGSWTNRQKRHVVELPPPPPFKDLFDSFQSIGDNCELGLVQGLYGSNQLGLLKFSNIPFDGLLRALDERFVRLSEPNLSIRLRPVEAPDGEREYFALESAYGILAHTAMYVPTPESDVISAHRSRLALLARMLIEDLEDATKIFVFKTNAPLPQSMITALFARMRAYGPVNLLWVKAADATKPAGHVEWLDEGLLCGRHTGFAPCEYASAFNAEAWRKCCTAALALCQDRGGD